MKSLKRNLIICLQFIALIIAIVLIVYRGIDKDWATVAAGLAVIAALIANFNGQRIAWRQEDEFEPDLELKYDLKSRTKLTLLSLKNVGGSNAYDVNVNFDTELLDMTNTVVRFENVPSISKGEELFKMVSGTVEFFKKIETGALGNVQSGTITFKKSPDERKVYSKRFSISIEHFRRSPSPETDADDFFQKGATISDTLKEINKSLQKIANSQKPHND
jgi:hypothetical protein